MRFGPTDSECAFIFQHVVGPLEKLGARVWCFGSRARGDHRSSSDLDLLVESSEDLRAKLFEISDALVESNFPYKVDLVQEKNLAKSYRAQVERERVPFDYGVLI